MALREYFEQIKGLGVLATADQAGNVDGAVYSKPYFVDEETIVFLMAERLTHSNVGANPHACYVFIESGEGYHGKRLYLTKTKEEPNSEMVGQVCECCDYSLYGGLLTGHVVYFHIDKVIPLVATD